MTRKNRLYLRLSDEELEAIKVRADEMNMSPARYSRDRVLGILKPRTDDLYRRQLVALGNNLNQIARHLNARRGKVVDVAEELFETMAQIRAQVAALDRAENDNDHSED